MIDIYTCPTSEPIPKAPVMPIDYMVAVMLAAKAGAPVQVYGHNATARGWHKWLSVTNPTWDWRLNSYRIDPASRPAAFKAGDWVVHAHGGPVHQVDRCDRSTLYLKGVTFDHNPLFFRLATPDELAALTPFKPGDWVTPKYGGCVCQVESCDGDKLRLKNNRTTYRAAGFRLATHDELIAPGHNPDKLTIEQVGEGWRLLDEDEVSEGRDPGVYDICEWISCSGWSGGGARGCCKHYTYRTKLSRAELAALDAPTSDQIRSNLLAQAAAQGWIVGNIIYGNQVITAVTAWVPGDMLSSHSVNVDHERVKGKPFVFVHYAPHFVQPLCGLRDAIPRSPFNTKRVPMRQEDWPAMFWIRGTTGSHHFPIVIDHVSITIARDYSLSYKDLMMHHQYSSDRITWHPCYREIPV